MAEWIFQQSLVELQAARTARGHTQQQVDKAERQLRDWLKRRVQRIHSAGRTAAVIDTIRAHPHPGLILHWFLGTPAEVAEAVTAGCYFSINAAMSTDVLQHIPPDRMLPETDFPGRPARQWLSGARRH